MASADTLLEPKVFRQCEASISDSVYLFTLNLVFYSKLAMIQNRMMLFWPISDTLLHPMNLCDALAYFLGITTICMEVVQKLQQ